MTPLFGHDAAVAAFREGLDAGRLHHAWLISGPEGLGKALFADKAATRVLAQAAGPPVDAPGLDVPDDHPIARLVEAGSHPDLMRLERLPRENGGGELARSIRIDQIRGLHRLFDMRPSLSERRVVVIDSADDLEGEGATNALLKMLEEPPAHAVFFLVSHRPESLKATIRSRCRSMRLKPLGDDAMTSALRAALPGASEAELRALAAAGQGSPGRAIAFRGLDIGALDRAMRDLAATGDPANSRRSELAAALCLKSAQARYEAFLARAPSFIAAAARGRSGRPLAEALGLYERAADLAAGATRLSLDPQSVVFELSGMIAALARPAGVTARR